MSEGDAQADVAVPQGYQRLDLYMGFTDLIGPLYHRVHEGREWIAMRIEQRHCNRSGNAHGGLLCALADTVVGRAARYAHQPKRGCVTVSLQTDFFQPAPLGAWVEACASVDRGGGSLAFVSCRMQIDGQHIGESRSVLKYVKPPAGAAAAPKEKK